MKKRILSIALVLCMVLAVLPTATIVKAATPTGTKLTQDNISGYMDGTTLKSGTYYLNGDITTGSTLKIYSNVTLDLNGHVLKFTGGSGSVIHVGNDSSSGTLTIKDSNPTGTHSVSNLPAGGVITGGNGVSESVGSAGGIHIKNGSVTMNGGTIYGCTANYGGGIHIQNGSVIMNNGSAISGCTAAKSKLFHGQGGGIYVAEGSVTMNGGTISGCTADQGSGVYLNSDSPEANFNLAGGKISGTIYTYYGSGSGNSTFTASGGSVTDDSGFSTFNKLIVPADSALNFNGKIANCNSSDSRIEGGTFEKDFCFSGDEYKGTISGGTFNGSVKSAGTITGGKFNGEVVGNIGTIKDGDFNAAVTNSKAGNITGGTFTKDVKNYATISGGTFENVKLFGSSWYGSIGKITGGVFNGEVSMDNTDGTYNITGGTFYGKVNDGNVNITGGTFYGGVDTNKISSEATWYEVKFDTDGGSPVPVTQVFVNPDSNAKAIEPSNPKKDGFQFLGWYNGNTEYKFDKPVTANVSLKAKWESNNVSSESELKNKINSGFDTVKLTSDINLTSLLDLSDKTLTIDLNGQVVTGDIKIADSSSSSKSEITLIDSAPTATHSDTSLPVGGVLKGNITLTRDGGSKSVLNANGGSVTGTLKLYSYASKVYNSNNKTTTSFYGNVDVAVNNAEICTGIYYKSLSQNFKSSVKGRLLTFCSDGKDYCYEVCVNEAIAVAPASPTKTGYHFDGWYTTATGGTKFDLSSAITADITLYARFTPNTYTVSYNAGASGTGTIAAGTKTYGVDFTLSSDIFTRTGYTQTGWATTDGGEKVYNLGGSYTGNAALTLYPVWKANQYTIIVKPENGGNDITITQDYGTTVTAPTLTRDGYAFNGWDKTFPTTMPAGSMTITAKWKDITAPVISGIVNGEIYCAVQTVTVSDNDGISSVTVNGNPVTPDTNGQFTLSVAEGEQKIVVTDKAGNKTEMTVTVNNGHTYYWQSENGKYWKKCNFCEHETAKKDIPEITINGADKVCVTQDYTFTFTLPEGVSAPKAAYYPEDNDHFLSFTESGGVYTATVSHTEYRANSTVTDFFVKAFAKTADGFEFQVSKEVLFQREHIGGTADCTHKAKCEVCGDEYGEVNADNHTTLKHIEAKAATVEAEGNIEYWHCEECGKYFSDKDGKTEIKLSDIVIAKLVKTESENKSPQTGDNSHAALWFALLFVSGGALAGITVYSKKKKRFVK